MVFEQRMKGLVALLKERNLDAAFLAPSSDLKYATGLDLKADSRLKGAVIGRDGGAFFLCPSLYKESVRAIEQFMPLVEWKDGEGFQDAFKKGLKSLNLEGNVKIAFTRGIEGGDLADLMAEAPIRAVNGFTLLTPMRSVKSLEEQALMRHASAMNDKMMEALAEYLRPGLWEKEIRAFIMDFHESHGGLPRVPAVATGVNSAQPHYSGDNPRMVEERDIVMVDCGGWYEGYSHDMTRTFFVGEPTEERRKVYSVVLDAQRSAEEKACAGAIPEDLDTIAREIIADGGYGDYFPHRLGHSIGMDGHEAPYIAQGNRTALAEGNCFSIEPGIYLPGNFGVRIENLVMLTPDGPEVINRFPVDLMVL